jgi:hypothetical protein
MSVSDDASTNQPSAVVPYLRDVDQRCSEKYAAKCPEDNISWSSGYRKDEDNSSVTCITVP